MKINGISGANFTSRIKVIENFYSTPEEIIGKKETSTLKRALRVLEQNEMDDTVKIFLFDDDENTTIGLKVEKNIKGKKYTGKSVIPLFYKNLKVENIYEAYAKALNEADGMCARVKTSSLDKFI